MKITWIMDCRDAVFDRSGILVYEDAEYDRDYRLDSEDYLIDEPTYELTDEGKELYERWADDAAVGYDLCNGRMKGLAALYTERQMFDELTTNNNLSTKIIDEL